jgi:hypothetical protein
MTLRGFPASKGMAGRLADAGTAGHQVHLPCLSNSTAKKGPDPGSSSSSVKANACDTLLC